MRCYYYHSSAGNKKQVKKVATEGARLAHLTPVFASGGKVVEYISSSHLLPMILRHTVIRSFETFFTRVFEYKTHPSISLVLCVHKKKKC
ncbi:hypothetical protein CEXT_751741 [Caerostris extrusa]|uniref:Uncharacterized protein n=1 Tax=Caerostris extrusa TaxID=172846 RepID=A0AAV4NR87_CAEEX|nr:hypothetical protein CEXT_751741 [Caerostris extrusa]